jgi:hypothetical protein
MFKSEHLFGDNSHKGETRLDTRLPADQTSSVGVLSTNLLNVD